MKASPPTIAQLNDSFAYCADTGFLTWRKDHGRWNHLKAGAFAGTMRPDGYFVVRAFEQCMLVHRIVWVIVFGYWPTGQIDHMDGNRSNNKLKNLRDVAPAINSQNQRHARGRTKSGVLGVRGQGKSWAAEIKVDGVRHYLGVRSTREEAQALYVSAKRRLHIGNTI